MKNLMLSSASFAIIAFLAWKFAKKTSKVSIGESTGKIGKRDKRA